MEDPESEWAIEEYQSPKEGMLKWILKKGYGIGKKVVITGILISSAPLVLPPLVVFSAMGVAFSIPFGLVFASYACTNKLMSKLLPAPPPPLMLQYFADEEEKEEIWVEDELRASLVIREEEEEEEQLEDIKQGVECRFELDEVGDDCWKIGGGLLTNLEGEKGYYTDEDEAEKEGGNEENVMQEEEEGGIRYIEQGNEIRLESDDEYGQEMEALMTNADGDLDEKGYLTDEDEKEMEADVVGLENMVQQEEGKQMEDDNKQGVEIELDDGVDNYREFLGSTITNADENVGEKGCHTHEKEQADNELKTENVLQEEEKEQIGGDTKHGAEVRFGLSGGDDDDYSQEGEALIINVDENVDERSCYTNENEDEKERENVIEEEEREQMEDIKQRVEMRLELQAHITNFGGSIDEQGYEEDVGEYLEGDDDSLEEERKGEEPSVEMDQVVSLVDVDNRTAREADGLYMVAGEINVEEEAMEDEEEEEIVKGSTGLLKKIRDGERIDNAVEDGDFLGESASNGVSEQAKDVETTEPITVKETDSQKLVKKGSKNKEPVGELRQVVVLAGGNEGNNFNSRQVEELDLVARQVVMDTDRRNTESEEKVMRESTGSQEETTSNDGSEDAILKRKKEHLIHSNADAREIGDESGLDLFDNRNTSMDLESFGAGEKAKEDPADDHVDVMALPTIRRPPPDSDNGKVADDMKVRTSTEENLDDEKIWEKIGAMRAIVGYKAPSQATYIGELKALYVFTGVEPPASFQANSDVDEVKAKLKFLMSIVGVK